MRHSKRDILKTDDIKFAMEKLSIPVTNLFNHFQNVFGYPSTIPYTYERDPTQQNLWYIKSQNIPLQSYATKPKLITPIQACAYKVHFEALDGVQPKIAETIEQKETPKPVNEQV